MFLGNYGNKNAGSSGMSTSTKANAANTQVTTSPMLGPTATANVNLGGNPLNNGAPTGTKPPNPASNPPGFPNQTVPGQQNTGVVQPLSSQGNQPPQNPYTKSPLPSSNGMGPNTSTAPSSKQPSSHSTTNPSRYDASKMSKPNGVRQSGPGFAFGTNFKAACDNTSKAPAKEKVIVPWDHTAQNYVYKEKDFDKLKPNVTMEKVKKVLLSSPRNWTRYRLIRVGIQFRDARHA